MPKRSFSAATEATGKGASASANANPARPFVQRKTERSHEENQERAYIAASRRSDRSLDARVQSARMASEIHKKRTGKSFRISEEIVQKEEMYEEEDDDVPRSYRLLGPHMQTASAEMNSKLEAYMSSRLAMSAYMSKMDDSWRENNINQMFAAAFPNLGMQAQQLGSDMFPQPPSASSASGNGQPLQSAADCATKPPVFHQSNYKQPTPDQSNPLSPLGGAGRGGAEQQMPTPDLTVASSPDSHSPELFKGHSGFGHLAATPAARPQMQDISGPNESAFTAELPQEMKLLLGGVPGMEMSGFGQDMSGQNFMPVDQALYSPELAGADKLGELDSTLTDTYGDDSWEFLTQTQPQPHQFIDEATDEPWDTFINDSAWDNGNNNSNTNECSTQ